MQLAQTLIVYRDREKGWRWRLRASNGRILADSGESYTRRRDALSGLHVVRRGLSEGAVRVVEGNGTLIDFWEDA